MIDNYVTSLHKIDLILDYLINLQLFKLVTIDGDNTHVVEEIS